MGPFFDVSAGQNTSLTEPKEHFSYRSPFDSCLIMKNRNPIKWPTLFYSSRQSFQRFMEKVLWVLPHTHRRRIKTEANAKVVAAVWGTELDSIPCRTTDLPPWLIWRKDWMNKAYLAKWMLWKRWMIIWFTPYQTTALPKWMFFQKLLYAHTANLTLPSWCFELQSKPEYWIRMNRLVKFLIYYYLLKINFSPFDCIRVTKQS